MSTFKDCLFQLLVISNKSTLIPLLGRCWQSWPDWLRPLSQKIPATKNWKIQNDKLQKKTLDEKKQKYSTCKNLSTLWNPTIKQTGKYQNLIKDDFWTHICIKGSIFHLQFVPVIDREKTCQYLKIEVYQVQDNSNCSLSSWGWSNLGLSSWG